MTLLGGDPTSYLLWKPLCGARERAPSRHFSNSLTVMALAQRTATVLNVTAQVQPLICWLPNFRGRLHIYACGTTPKDRVVLALCSLGAGAAVRSQRPCGLSTPTF